MVERTTLAERLSTVFGRMTPLIPPKPSTGKTLFSLWSEALGGRQRDALSTAAAIGTVSLAFSKLQAQVEASGRFRDTQKASALETLAQFQGLFDLNAFSHDAYNYKTACSAKSCGDLGIIGVSLEREFSEPRLDKASAEELSVSLNDVSKLLHNPDIPVDLQVTLQKHINAMLW